MTTSKFAGYAALFVAALLAGCGTTSVGLKYEPSTHLSAAAVGLPELSVGSFVDQRGEPAQWLGAIRGGFGNPLKNLELRQPASKLVETAFTDGLRARLFLLSESNASYQISGLIRKLDCNQIALREANVEIELSVTHLPSGRQIFSHPYSASNIEGSIFGGGIFASVEDLRALTERTLREVVDKALDDSAFRNALRHNETNPRPPFANGPPKRPRNAPPTRFRIRF